MQPTSYTLSYTPGASQRGDDGFFNLKKKVIQRFARESPQPPDGLAGINLVTTKKYKSIYPSSDSISKNVHRVFQSLGLKARERFSRDYKPIDHLGGASPENRLPLHGFMTTNDFNRDLELWPKSGNTFEDMDILIN